jgi:hypothetical protein
MKSSREFAQLLETWYTLKYELGLTQTIIVPKFFPDQKDIGATSLREDHIVFACWIMSDAFADVDQEIRVKGWPLTKEDIEKLATDFENDFDRIMYHQLTGQTNYKFIDAAERFIKSVQDLVITKSALMA